MFDELKIENPIKEKYEAYKETTKLELFYPFKEFCIVSKNPIEIHVKDTKLHNDEGPAIKYADDYSQYYIDGKYISEKDFDIIKQIKTELKSGIKKSAILYNKHPNELVAKYAWSIIDG